MRLNNLLFIVLAIYIIMKILLPQLENINNINTRIMVLKSTINKYNSILNNKEQITKLKKDFINAEKKNLTFVFNKKNNTDVFVEFQKLIKDSASKATIKIRNLKWLNAENKKFYYEIPIKVTFDTIPENFYNFLKILCEKKKIIVSKILKLKVNKNVHYEIILKTFNIKD